MGKSALAVRKQNKHRRERKRAEDNVVQLFEILPYDRNRVSRSQIQQLRDQIDSIGGPATADEMGVGELVMYKVSAGFAHTLRPATAAKVREYFSR